MVLGNLRNKKCPICDTRGDYIGRKNVIEIKNEEKIVELNNFFKNKKTEVKLNNIICLKHLKNMKSRNKNIPGVENENYYDTENVNEIEHENQNHIENQDLNGYENVENEHAELLNTQTSSLIDIQTDENNQNYNTVLVDLPITYSSHAFCFICKAPSGFKKLLSFYIATI